MPSLFYKSYCSCEGRNGAEVLDPVTAACVKKMDSMERSC